MVIGDMVYILIKTNQLNDAKNLLKQYMDTMMKKNQTDDLSKNVELNYINMIQILLLGATNNIERANLLCLDMVEKYPDSFDVNYYAAIYHHLYSKDYDKADKYYRTAISIQDYWAKIYLNYALLYKELNDLAQYVKYIKIAYEKNPKIPKIKKLYEKVYDENGVLRAKIINQM